MVFFGRPAIIGPLSTAPRHIDKSTDDYVNCDDSRYSRIYTTTSQRILEYTFKDVDLRDVVCGDRKDNHEQGEQK